MTRKRPKAQSNRKPVGVAIELTPRQVDQIVRGVTEGGIMAILLSRQPGIQRTLGREAELGQDPRVSHSLVAGLAVFAGLPFDGSYIGVVALAKKVNKSSSTTHRYLATLQLFGLVEQHSNTRKYRLAK